MIKRKNWWPLLLCGVLCGGVLSPLAPARADEESSVAAAPAQATQDGAPLRDGERVLFRFHAPANAQKVYLAGSFNGYADNVNGAIGDDKFALTDAGDGHYFARVFVKPDVERYKFVVLDKNGQFNWLSDPNVAPTDNDGNSVLDFSQIGRIPATSKRQGPPVRAGEDALFRFRAPAGAQKVFLAGSFNNYADNVNGAIGDDKFAMTPDANGLYLKRVNISDTTENYKFVVVNQAGETVWMNDPNVEATDDNGNSVVDFGKIENLP